METGTKKQTVKSILKIVGLLLLILVVLAAIAFGILYVKAKPTIDLAVERAEESLSEMNASTFRPLHDTVVYDKDKNIISEINISNYEYVEIDNVSKFIYNGYIATEDRNFLKHGGVDYKALIRAGIALVKNKGSITQGGSTITQQVIKNNMLSQEKTYTRKIAEIIIAPKLEDKFTKDDIMEFYVNTNFYGNNCNGIQSASKYYFGKDASELNLQEAATLVGVSNNPSAFNPVKHPQACIEKRNRVLDQMLSCGYISESEYKEAYGSDLQLTLEREAREPESYMVSYAVYSLAIEMMKLEGFEFKYTFANKKEYEDYKTLYSDEYSKMADKVRAGGYDIYTAFDLDIQEKLQEAVDTGLKGFREKQDNGKYNMQGAAVCIDNKTGYVVAIVGGRGTNDEFNRAFLSSRQPGSTAKPIVVYGPAFETGAYYPSMKVKDEFIEDGPSNYSEEYIGSVSLRDALARSINTVAYKTFTEIGVNESLGYLSKLKISSLSYLDSDNFALGLGGFTYGVKPVEWAKAYNALANNGIFSDKSCLVLVRNERDGEIYNSGKVKPYRVFTSDIAYIVTDCLKGVIDESYGSGYGLRLNGITAAGKTGTTNDRKDGWFAGYTKYYTTVVWAGCDQPKRVDGLIGASYPGHIWKDIMTQLHDGVEDKDWSQPDTVELRHVNWKGEQVDYKSSYEDLFSLQAENRAAEEKEKRAQEKAENELRAKDERAYSKALNAINELQKFDVNTVEDAVKLFELYEAAKSALDNVRDEYEKKSSLEAQFSVLTSQTEYTLAEWESQIEEYKAEQTKIADTESKIEAAWQSIRVLQSYISVSDQMYVDIDKAVAAVDAVGQISDYEPAQIAYVELLGYLNKEKVRLLREGEY